MDKEIDGAAINKLIILILIREIELNLSNAEISEFCTINSFMEYFDVQHALAEMTEANLLSKAEENHSTYYKLTAEGEKVLSMFSDKVPSYIKKVIFLYCQENSTRFKNKREVQATYVALEDNEYFVKCSILENGNISLGVNVNVASKELAKDICYNWKNNASYLYGTIFKGLTTKKPQS